METYNARYGERECWAYPESYNGEHRYFTVSLKKDPGYGSMLFTHIHRSQLRFETEPPTEKV